MFKKGTLIFQLSVNYLAKSKNDDEISLKILPFFLTANEISEYKDSKELLGQSDSDFHDFMRGHLKEVFKLNAFIDPNKKTLRKLKIFESDEKQEECDNDKKSRKNSSQENSLNKIKSIHFSKPSKKTLDFCCDPHALDIVKSVRRDTMLFERACMRRDFIAHYHYLEFMFRDSLRQIQKIQNLCKREHHSSQRNITRFPNLKRPKQD